MSKIALQELVDRYSANRDYYLSATYNETQLRADFLDPLFEILGWDIKNSQGKSTNEREVLLEEPLREDVSSNTKKPDYTFRLFSQRKFYVEAKKPSVNIFSDPEPAKQTRRYGFTAKLKISVLSNFEQLAIYDCSEKVEETDTSAKARIKIYNYTEFVDAYDEIMREFGYSSVYSGEFDVVWEHIEERLKLFSVDNLFLSQINDWRLILGTEIFNHRPEITQPELNDIVQRYLNSIIFLRVSEDRNLETYKTLLNIATSENFDQLVAKFLDADAKYNSGLFNHGLTEEVIRNSDSAFWTIIRQLYYPESTYSFSVFASDILGNIYEIFLSEQLVVSDGVVTLSKKPDHIDRDVVTTPTFIIQDIIKQTIGEYCENLTDEEILSSKFADIACGSGAFLLETYQLVNDILIDYYLRNAPENLIQTSVNSFKLPFAKKRRILENCLVGVDKDFNAVEACKFGLLLKLLEDENSGSIPVPALPDISSSIRYGNSLIEREDTVAENKAVINPYDFGDEKFDVIVGNPPYMSTEDMNTLTPAELPIYKEKYSTAYKQFDKYFIFIERAYDLLKSGGQLGYIVPSKFLKVGSARELRIFFKTTQSLRKLVSFGSNQIFQDKTTYTCLLILKKDEAPQFNFLEVNNLNQWKVRNIADDEYESVVYDELDDEGWVLVPNYLKEIYQKINSRSTPLATLVGEENIYNGIQTSANRVYIHKPVREDESYVYFVKDGREWSVEKLLTRPYFETSSGNDSLNTYRPFKPNSFVIYPYIKVGNVIAFVNIERLRQEFPRMYEYLHAYREVLQSPTRDIKPAPTTYGEWYRYGRHQSLDKCDVPAKIIVGVLSQGNKYAIDYYASLISSGGTAGYCMITIPSDSPYSIYYIQALLNSKYLEWYSALIGEVFRGGYIARGTKVLKRLPIRVIDFSREEDVTLHNAISSMQERLILLQGQIDDNITNERALIPLKREFDSLKSEVDQQVKVLFGIDDDEEGLVPLISEMYATKE